MKTVKLLKQPSTKKLIELFFENKSKSMSTVKFSWGNKFVSVIKRTYDDVPWEIKTEENVQSIINPKLYAKNNSKIKRLEREIQLLENPEAELARLHKKRSKLRGSKKAAITRKIKALESGGRVNVLKQELESLRLKQSGLKKLTTITTFEYLDRNLTVQKFRKARFIAQPIRLEKLRDDQRYRVAGFAIQPFITGSDEVIEVETTFVRTMGAEEIRKLANGYATIYWITSAVSATEEGSRADFTGGRVSARLKTQRQRNAKKLAGG